MLILRMGSMLNGSFDQVQSLLNEQVRAVGDTLDTFVFRVGISNTRYSFAVAAGLLNSVVGACLLILSDRLAKRLGERGLF
jgi:putative aldouronate transport system permease protein